MGRDALTNVLREWWPDIAIHVCIAIRDEMKLLSCAMATLEFA
jgi:hypothetical protein